MPRLGEHAKSHAHTENLSTALVCAWRFEAGQTTDWSPRPRQRHAFHVLVLDDPRGLAEVRRLLETHALVSSANTAAQALTLVDRTPVDAVISALDLDGARDGAWLLSRIARHWPATRRVLLASAPSDRVSLALAHRHAQQVVWQPTTRRALLSALAGASAPVDDAISPLARVLLGPATCKSKS